MPTSLAVAAVALFLLAVGAAISVMAQEEEEVWSTPLNLSQTGAATQPVAVTDADGEFHVIWQDAYAGFVYTQGDGETWTRPLPLRLPFSEPAFSAPGDVDDRSTSQVNEAFAALYQPLLAIDDDQQLHAFWNGAAQVLFYSRVAVSDLITPTAWTTPESLTEATVVQDVWVGTDGRLHLGYIRPTSTEEFPTGVYYRRWEGGGISWTEPALIYQSDYLRGITASQANVHITADGGGEVHLVWDDRLLDAVFYARSQDGGTTWSTPEKIDKRTQEDEPAAAGPAMINMVVDGNEIHLTWQAQHEDSNCAQYHQWSADSGRTWQPRIVAYEDVQGCPTGGRFVLSSNDLLFLLIDTQQGVLLQAWDGERWSEPELQQPMSSFTNPETYRQVAFACRQAAVSADNRLFEFGCGTSNGQDVWVIGRSLGDLTDWSTRFEPSPVWSTPAVVFESQLTLLSPALVVDAAGLLHAFWIETDETTLTVPDTKIYHTQWNGTAWSRVVPLLNLPAQRADQFSAIVDANERLLVMWRNPELNIFFISQVDGEQVLIPPQWSTPRELLPPQTLAAHPSLLVDKVGALHVVYAVPLNEGRGIYWMKSDDGANTWSEPALVFDAAAAGWEALDEPYLAQTGNGHLHLLWARQNALQDEPLSQALSYARSEDDGQSWSEPQLIAEGRISWHHLGSVGERTVLVAWQQEESGQTRLMSRHSYDSGATWEQPLQISLGFATDAFGKPSLVMDRAYQLHLVQLTATGFGNSGLQAWLWRGNNWEIGESLDFEAQLADVTFVDSAVVTAGDTRLVIIYTGGVVQQGSVQLSSDLFFTQRVLELPPGTPTPLPIVAPAATSSPTVTPAVVPTPTSQPEIPPDTNAVDNESLIGFIESSPPSTRLAISVIPAGLIVLVIVALYLTVARRVR